GEQVAATLAELHRRGAVHRTLQAASIWWNAGSGHAWLIDLGESALPVDGRIPFVAASAERLACMAPEQTGRIDRPVDARTDLYALGMVLDRLLTGRPV